MTDAATLAAESLSAIRDELRKVMEPESVDRVVKALDNLIEAKVLIGTTRAMPPLR